MYLRAYQDAGMGLVVVRGVHTVESLLAGCVPEICRQSERKVGFARASRKNKPSIYRNGQ